MGLLFMESASLDAQVPVQTSVPPPPPSRLRKKQEVTSDKPHEGDFRKIRERRGKLNLMTEIPVDVCFRFSAMFNLSTSFVTGTEGKILWK